jgi:hypothetical protein
MPIPPALTNRQFGHVWTGNLNVGPNVRNPGRGVVTKRFLAYIESYEQSAHDATIAGYALQIGGASRPPHRGQVQPANNNRQQPLAYYAVHGQVAAGLAAAEMQRRWTAAAAGGANPTVFQPGRAYPLAVQGQQQPNGFHYEVTMWYDVADVYVAFHCYHP